MRNSEAISKVVTILHALSSLRNSSVLLLSRTELRMRMWATPVHPRHSNSKQALLWLQAFSEPAWDCVY